MTSLLKKGLRGWRGIVYLPDGRPPGRCAAPSRDFHAYKETSLFKRRALPGWQGDHDPVHDLNRDPDYDPDRKLPNGSGGWAWALTF